MMKDKTIAVIMTVHNRKNTTLECLRRLFDCNIPDGISLLVYLMDDGSTDGTREAILKEYPIVKVLQGNGNLYWNQGMRAAWKEALKQHHDFYMWLNDDTMLYNNVLTELIDVYKQLPETSIVTGQLCSSYDSTRQTYGGKFGGKVIKPDGKIEKCDLMCGNVVLVPQVVVDKIGVLCRFYKHKWGDYDYAVLANKKGVGVYTTRCFVGICDVHSVQSKCYNPDVPFKTRLKSFFSPLGGTPLEYIIFNFRTKPFKNAFIGSTFSNWDHFMMCLFPK